MRSPSTRPIVLAALVIAAAVVVLGQEQERRWLAGDSHIHSHWSPGYDRSTDPPTPVKGQDAIYSTPTNARKAEEFGLSWMVTTDHGGPHHAKFNLDTEASALRALAFVRTLERLPLMFANHPSRSATGVGRYGLDEPREFRANHDLAPEVYRGMEGAPGHQANTLAPDGSVRTDASGIPSGHRGSYANPGAGTFGGFDQMTARVGGLWDALLGEGRRFWIVATSDSHVHHTETSRAGGDFWPGENPWTDLWMYSNPVFLDVGRGH